MTVKLKIEIHNEDKQLPYWVINPKTGEIFAKCQSSILAAALICFIGEEGH